MRIFNIKDKQRVISVYIQFKLLIVNYNRRKWDLFLVLSKSLYWDK